MADKVKVIGAGRLANGDVVVTAAVKAALVSRLREHYQMYVWAFGDSSLGLEMMRVANEAIVVVDGGQGRSKTMDTELTKAIDRGGLKAHQMLMRAPPRLNFTKLPEIQLTEVEARIQPPFIAHATEKGSAKLLMTPTRDAKIQGPALQDAHRRVGRYLATDFLTDIVGLEEYHIKHGQEDREASGHRLLHEDKTLIVGLMRGGLPMAEGVNEAFPSACILHAKVADDVVVENLVGRSTVMLVDGVINEDKTVKKFVEHIRSLNATVRIVVVAGVVQAQSVEEDGPLRTLARKHGKINVVALRLSEN